MSYGCMYILRNAQRTEEFKDKIVTFAKENECGIWLKPKNNLLIEHSVVLNVKDFIFEVCDGFDSDDASLLLCYENCPINGQLPKKSLYQRLEILQNIASICIPYAEMIEMYIGEDTPYLSDYSDYQLKHTDIADILFEKYQSGDDIPWIPCVHFVIHNTERLA